MLVIHSRQEKSVGLLCSDQQNAFISKSDVQVAKFSAVWLLPETISLFTVQNVESAWEYSLQLLKLEQAASTAADTHLLLFYKLFSSVVVILGVSEPQTA